MPGMPSGTDSEPADLRNVARPSELWRSMRRTKRVPELPLGQTAGDFGSTMRIHHFGRSANSPGLISRAFLEWPVLEWRVA
jgi:hypothetical protein